MRSARAVGVFLAFLLFGCSTGDTPGYPGPTVQNSLGEGTPISFAAASRIAGGAAEVVVEVSKGFYEQSILPGSNGPGDAILVASVDGCNGTQILSILESGTVTPIAGSPHANVTSGYLWTVTVDLSACRCQDPGTRTHHCDGCGRTFDSCQHGGASCAARPVTLVVDAFDRPARTMCSSHDFDGVARSESDCPADLPTPTVGHGCDGV
jgi:hypothetical protein